MHSIVEIMTVTDYHFTGKQMSNQSKILTIVKRYTQSNTQKLWYTKDSSLSPSLRSFPNSVPVSPSSYCFISSLTLFYWIPAKRNEGIERLTDCISGWGSWRRRWWQCSSWIRTCVISVPGFPALRVNWPNPSSTASATVMRYSAN